MRAEQQLNLDMGGDCFQIVCEDPQIIEQLRPALTPWMVEGPGLIGYKIVAPNESTPLWILIGSDGAILSRSRTAEPVVRALQRHLMALAAPDLPSAVRLGLTGVVGPRGVALVDPEVLRTQPLVERQLQRMDMAVIDSPFVQLRPGETIALPIYVTDETETDIGHQSATVGPAPIVGVIWHAYADALQPTRGQAAHALAVSARTGSHAERIEAGISWSHLPALITDDNSKGGLHRALSTLLAGSID